MKMATIKCLARNDKKSLAVISVQGEPSKIGLIPEKVGMIHFDPEVFKLEKGESIEDDTVTFAKAEVRKSISSDGTVFDWLVF